MPTLKAQLLQTKTRVPQLPVGFVPRPRLSRRLIEAMRHGVVLLSAPAGYGKTTVLAEALRQIRMPVGWVSLEDGDDDPVSFWMYVVTALQALEPGMCRPILSALESPEPPSTQWLLTSLVNALSGRGDDIALVLDDYHAISSPAIHEGITFIGDHMPPHLHLVIAGRSDPPLPSARWRARGVLAEIPARELAFTIAESAAFLELNAGTVLDARDVTTLQDRSEGWIAGLKMAALSLAGRRDISASIASFSGSNRFILGYLAEEVLDRQPLRTRQFLLDTSILRRLSAPLADAVTGHADGQSMLAQLESANLFISPLDDERRWYRYHQLFADVLRGHLAAQDPDRVRMLHSRASAWFESQELHDEAIDHSLLAGDGERAVGILEGSAPRMLGEGQAAWLLRYTSRIPEPLLATSPWLCVSFAWAALMTHDQERLQPMLSRAAMALSQSPERLSACSRDNFQRIKGHLLSIQSFAARAHGDIHRAMDLSQEASRQLPGDEPGDRVAHAVNSLNLAACYQESGEIEKALPFLEELAAAGRTGGFSYAALAAQASRAEVEMQLSRLDRAAEICTQAIAQGAEYGSDRPIPGAALACIVQGRIEYERNDLEGAAISLCKGIELGELSANPEPVLKGCLSMADLSQAQGNHEAAVEYLRRAGSVGPWVTAPPESRQVPAWKSRIDLRGGDILAATSWAKAEEKSMPVSHAPRYDEERTWLTLVRVKIALGDRRGLSTHLDRFIRNAELQSRIAAVIEGLILKALVLDNDGASSEAASSEAMKCLDRALSLAEPARYVRTFLDEGPSVFRLLQRVAEEGAHADYAVRLLGAMSAHAAAGSSSTGATGPGLPGTLSRREMEVLRLIADGKPNKEIAFELFLAVGTVKKHTNNIFGKLGAQSRTQAVARARELGILP